MHRAATHELCLSKNNSNLHVQTGLSKQLNLETALIILVWLKMQQPLGKASARGEKGVILRFDLTTADGSGTVY